MLKSRASDGRALTVRVTHCINDLNWLPPYTHHTLYARGRRGPQAKGCTRTSKLQPLGRTPALKRVRLGRLTFYWSRPCERQPPRSAEVRSAHPGQACGGKREAYRPHVSIGASKPQRARAQVSESKQSRRPEQGTHRRTVRQTGDHQIGRGTDAQTDRRTDTQHANIQTARRQTATDKQTDRHTDTQTDRHTNGPTHRQTDRQTDRHRQT